MHAPRAADAGVWDIAVTGDFIRCVNHYDALVQFVSQKARDFPQHRCLAHPGSSQQQHALSSPYQVFDDTNSAEYRSSNTASQADDLALPVSNARNPVQCPFNARPVVRGKFADPRDDRIYVFLRHLGLA